MNTYTRRELKLLCLAELIAEVSQLDIRNTVTVEIGVGAGWSAGVISRLMKTESIHLYDTFNGFPRGRHGKDSKDFKPEHKAEYKKFDITYIQQNIVASTLKDYPWKHVELHPGEATETLPNLQARVSFCHIDCDLYDGYKAGLEQIYPRLIDGGVILFDEYDGPRDIEKWPGAKIAIDEFLEQNVDINIERHSSGFCYIKKKIIKQLSSHNKITPNVQQVANRSWQKFYQSRSISIKRYPVLTKAAKVFTIGSCFAEEIRKALSEHKIAVLPKFEELSIDKEYCLADGLPDRPHLNFYNTFTIQQELERIAGVYEQAVDDVWTVKDFPWPGNCYQDPYRRLVFGRTKEHLASINRMIDSSIRKGFADAGCFVITFGMAENFRDKISGRIVGQKPGYSGGGGLNETLLVKSSFNDTYLSVSRIVELISKMKGPDVPIFLTVSPVALAHTFYKEDIFVTNVGDKSMLRAVLRQICQQYSNALYFPSYEIVIANGEDSFSDDGRHVKPCVVRSVVKAFMEAHFSE